MDSKAKTIITFISVILVLLILGTFIYTSSTNTNKTTMDTNKSTSNPTNTPSNSASPTNPTQDQSRIAELIKEDVVVGTGKEALEGDMLTVNYTGKFLDGKVFDTSVGKSPFQFRLGSGQVIQGWDQGFGGMKEGGKRILKVPYSLAYGESGYGPIPAKSDLIFEVELIKVGQ